ncbi:MAG: oxidoreductase family protein [Crocinitomicaceae bacterium]
MASNFIKYVLDITSAEDCFESEIIQSLWSGYGKVVRYQLIGSDLESVIVKHIAPTKSVSHPRGWNTDLSHQRKVKSYKVEMNWYKNWNQFTNVNCKTPQFLGFYSEKENHWIVMEDLSTNYPMIKTDVNVSEVKIGLNWLANFHATFLGEKPIGLWDIGTYWHLDTRPDEFEKIENVELKAKAYLVDETLNQCQYKTIVHGDAKIANFCFSENRKQIAAVDFQYVGGGCGMKDVAYFLGSCLSGADCNLNESLYLNYYFSELKSAIIEMKKDIDFMALETEWRSMYPFSSADFSRFLLGWMPNHQKLNAYSLKILNSVLAGL